jgi:hypothetical protein
MSTPAAMSSVAEQWRKQCRWVSIPPRRASRLYRWVTAFAWIIVEPSRARDNTKPSRRTLWIESTFATVRHHTKITRGPGSRVAGLALAFKLIEVAQDRRHAVNAPHRVALVRATAVFVNGKLVERPDETHQAEAGHDTWVSARRSRPVRAGRRSPEPRPGPWRTRCPARYDRYRPCSPASWPTRGH